MPNIKKYFTAAQKKAARLRDRKKWRITHRESAAFVQAKQRCTNPNEISYPRYGGRGIKCKLKSYKDIIYTIGRRPSNKYSLDRIDNDVHYEIGNIRWATIKQQRANSTIVNQTGFCRGPK
jgi:hypothetical protein